MILEAIQNHPTPIPASTAAPVRDTATYLAERFNQGLQFDSSKWTEKKGSYTYLSWVYGIRELTKLYPLAAWGWDHFTWSDGEVHPYMRDPAGPFVRARIQLHPQAPVIQFDHPVLDNKMKTITEPTSFDINSSRMRALSKLISMSTGIGLHLYAGEDLPDDFAGGIEADTTEVAEVKSLLEGDLGQRRLPDGKTLQEVYTKRLEASGWARKDVGALLRTLRALA